MSRNRAARLAPVVEMAERAEREAARMLGRCQGQLTQAEMKLGELEPPDSLVGRQAVAAEREDLARELGAR